MFAAALRLHSLGRQPLWWDEGISLFFAPMTLYENAQATVLLRDVSPPVYRYGLGRWGLVAGTGPFATRFPSIAAGVLAVALTWAVGRRLLGPRTALAGAFLTAVAPMQVYYSQEAKGYPLEQAALLAAAWLWLWLAGPRGTGAGRARRIAGWIGYTAALTVALGTHYTAGFLVATHGLWTLVAALRARPSLPGTYGTAVVKRLLPFGLACMAAGLVLLPWLLLTAQGSGSGLEAASRPGDVIATLGVLNYLARFGAEFAVGAPAAGQSALAGVAALALAGFTAAGGILLSIRRAAGSRHAAWILLTWTLAPLVMGFLFQLRFPFFFPRFLLYITPGFCLLIAATLVMVWERRRAVAVVLSSATLAGCAAGLVPIYTTPLLHNEDWRPLLAQVRPYVRSGDVVIHTYMWVEGYFRSYLAGTDFEYVFGFYSPEKVDAELGALTALHPRVWLVGYETTSDDPGNLAANWLNTHAARVQVFTTEAAELALYAWPAPAAGPETAVRFGNRLELRYAPGAVGTAAAGEPLVFRFTWEALAPIAEDLRVYLHVIDPDGQLLASADGSPVNGLAPFFTLQPGRPVQDPRGILLPADLPPGYQVTLGVYDPATGARWEVHDALGRPLGDEIPMPR